MKPFHSSAGGIGVYHRHVDCRHAKQIKAGNRCDAGVGEIHVRGCAWARIVLDPCPNCGRPWPERQEDPLTIEELARTLKHFMAKAPEGKKGLYYRVFGIRYAEDLVGVDLDNLMDLARRADIAQHRVSIEQGIELADFVVARL